MPRVGISRVLSGALALGAAALVWAHHPAASLPRGSTVDRLVVHKSARRMDLYADGARLRSYRIALGRHPVGPKRRAGDQRTPEGSYIIDGHNPNSTFHLSLHISYPAAADAARARAAGYPPGGEVMIHGARNGRGWLRRLSLPADWTDGCIAVTDAEMDELYRAVPDGTPIEIRP